MAFSLKAINFDLDTKKLKLYYPNKHWRQAYRDIRHFLKKAGFVHRQGSGYRSNQPFDFLDVHLIIQDMSKKLPWIQDCVSVCDVTEIGDTYSLISSFKVNTHFHINDEPLIENNLPQKIPIDEQIGSAEKVRDAQQQSNIKSQKIENTR